MFTKGFLTMGFWILAIQPARAVEFYKGRLIMEGYSDPRWSEVQLYMEIKNDITEGWVLVGPMDQIRLYGSAGGALNLIWSDGHRSVLVLKSENQALIASWQTMDGVSQNAKLVKQQEQTLSGEFLRNTQCSFLKNAERYMWELIQLKTYQKGLDYFSALAHAFPNDFTLPGFAATFAKLAKEKGIQAVLQRESSTRLGNKATRESFLSDCRRSKSRSKKPVNVSPGGFRIPKPVDLDEKTWQEKNAFIRNMGLAFENARSGRNGRTESWSLPSSVDAISRRVISSSIRKARLSDNFVFKSMVSQYRAKQTTYATLALRRPEDGQQAAHQDALAKAKKDLDGLVFRMLILNQTSKENRISANDFRNRLNSRSAVVAFRAFKGTQILQDGTELEGQHLRALILKNDGLTSSPYIKIGPLHPIARNIQAWRRAVTGRWRKSDIAAIGRSIYAQVWQPLASQLPGIKTIYVVTDGPLHLLPLGALPLTEAQLLGDAVDLVYVDAVHDLVQAPVPLAKGPPLMVYDPDYGANEDQSFKTDPVTIARDRHNLRFTPLPGAKAEGEQVFALLEKAGLQPKRLTGRAATEQALGEALESGGSSLLHIASHGFFLNRLPEPATQNGTSRFGAEPTLGADTSAESQSAAPTDSGDPMLRSGIALANANEPTPPNAGHDGLLTALEAESLNLTGTALVVLAACETGLGERPLGEDVYGLRRAFFLAGARALLTTLWEVDDQATQRFMVRFLRVVFGRFGTAVGLAAGSTGVSSEPGLQPPLFLGPFPPHSGPQPERIEMKTNKNSGYPIGFSSFEMNY